MSKVEENHINFIRNELIDLILNSNDDLRDKKVVNVNVRASKTLDGFISFIYQLELTVDSKNHETHQLIVKLVKSRGNHEEFVLSHIQCYNEIFIYNKVMKYYQKILKKFNGELGPDVWIPRIYYADSIESKELGSKQEFILAMENLTPQGYRLGPKLSLNEEHLTLMAKVIAQYHAVSYALKINKDPCFNELTDGLKPFDFVQESRRSMFDLLYPIALRRLFDYYFESAVQTETDQKFKNVMETFKTKFADKAVEFMQKFLHKDETFSVILHGDFNRNNVLFAYDSPDGFDHPKAVKMIDFQQVRFGSPAIDLSFFMFMDMDHELRTEIWDKLIICYHTEMITTLAKILNCDESDARLSPYFFENFLQHFSDFAFYGAMVAIHFVPVMSGTTEELEAIENDFHDDYFSKEAIETHYKVGGIQGREKIVKIARFAFEKGYMGFLEKFE